MNSWFEKYHIGFACALILIFVLVRWWVLGKDFSAFVMLTEERVIEEVFDRPFTFQNGGYDGYTFYSYAQDPLTIPEKTIESATDKTIFHINGVIQARNYPFRKKRIGYPVASWIASGFGQIQYIPLALVLVNVLAIATLYLFTIQLSRIFKWRSVWAVFTLTFVGAYICIARDLSDLMALSMATGALYYLLVNRLGLSVLFALAAIFTKESVLFMLVIPYWWHLWQVRKDWTSVLIKSTLLALPFLFYLLWNYYLIKESSAIAGYRSPAANFSWPFQGMIQGFSNSSSMASTLLAILLTFSIYSLAMEGIKSISRHNVWHADLSLLLSLLLIVHVVVSLCFSYKIYEDFWSLGRNLLPLQLTAFFVIMNEKGRISNFNLSLSIVVGAIYYTWMLFIP